MTSVIEEMESRSQIDGMCTLITLLVRAMVSNCDAVTVSPVLSSNAPTIIQIKVAPGSDMGKLIGKQGRTARSLRIIFQTIAKEQGRHYRFDIEGASIETAIGS